jgi:hypothetical protein
MTRPLRPRAAPAHIDLDDAPRTTSAERARTRVAATLLATIGVATLLGVLYLTQTLRATAARYEIDSLLREQQALRRELQSQEGVIAHWGSQARVVEWAVQRGLDRLGGRIRVSAR